MALIGYCRNRQSWIKVNARSTVVRTNIKDYTACVICTLIYSNDQTEDLLPAKFQFPLSDDSAVYHFKVDMDGKVVVGECQEKKTQHSIQTENYSQFNMLRSCQETAEGEDKFFEMEIGALGIGKNVTITFKYVTKLSMNFDGEAKFTLPETLILSDDSRRFVQNFDFHANIKGSKSVLTVNTNEAPISWRKTREGKVEVCLKQGCKPVNTFGFVVVYNEPHVPSITICKGSDSDNGFLKQYVAMIIFFPRMNVLEIAENVEFIFIMDRSGSMYGEKMEQAKSTLLLFLKSLPTGCCFNIISFGSSFTTLFPGESRTYNESSLREATQLQSVMEADMGGTNLFQPLQYVFDKLELRPGFCRQVFVVTDGAVSNPEACIQLVEQNSHHTKVFSFGIGQGASHELVSGIATAGKGQAEFITDSSQLQSKVVLNQRVAMQPSVMNFSVKWQKPAGVTIDTVPSSIPVIFSGEYVLIYALIQTKTLTNDTISATLTGKHGGRELRETISFRLQEAQLDEEFTLHRLAAVKKLTLLEKNVESVQKELRPNVVWNSASLLGDHYEQPMNQEIKDILALSMASNIVCKFTELKGVDKETKAVKYDQVQVPLPSSGIRKIGSEIPSGPLRPQVRKKKKVPTATLR